MKFNRREALALGAGALFISVLPLPASAVSPKSDEAIKAFTGGKEAMESGLISLDLPEIAENGNTVPLSVTVDSPMTADNYVKQVMLLADGNPNPGVATFQFTPKSGVAEASSRMRLAKTQDVIAVAELSDGSFHIAKTQVKVTIGGCGG
ncbi:thiosulfate oxidation carrier protein SoxY [Rhodovibrionaceae bacterium A322]